MKPRAGLPVAVWALFGLLVLSAALITLGRAGSGASPSANSYEPDGMRGFRELLERSGLHVSVSRRARPALNVRSLAVAAIVPAPPSLADPGGPDAGERGIADRLRRHVEEGGSALLLVLPKSSFASRGDSAGAGSATSTLDPDRGPLAISLAPSSAIEPWLGSYGWSMNGATIWEIGESPFVIAKSLGNGTVARVVDATGATNRYLGVAQNAALFAEIAQRLAEPGREVVFLEAAHSPPAEPALIEYFGPGASAAWYQAIFVFVLGAVALGRRFGIPDGGRFVQRGTRELVGALAGTYQRARATDVASMAIVESADREIRKRLKIAQDTPAANRDERLPPSLADALRKAEALREGRAPISVAFPILARLDNELRSFAKSSARPNARKTRS